MNAARLEQRSWLIFDSTFTVQIANIKEEYLDLKPYRDGRKVLPDLSKDAEIVKQNATKRKTDSEAMRIAKACS